MSKILNQRGLESPPVALPAGQVVNSNIEPAEFLNGTHSKCDITRCYFRDDHLAQLPVGGEDGAACDIIKTAAATGAMKMVWIVQRVGGMPTIPSRSTGVDNEVYQDGSLCIAAPSLLPDGITRVYALYGEYNYLLKVPPDETYTVHRSFFEKAPRRAEIIVPANFKTVS